MRISKLDTVVIALRLLAAALILLMASLADSAVVHAQNIGDACITTGWLNVQPNEILYCSTSNVWALGEQITSTGFVGIGTTTPAVRFHVISPNSTYGTTVAIDTIGTGQQALVSFYEQGNQYWQLGKGVDQSLFIYDAKGTRADLQLASNGNMTLMGGGGYVGIGASPITSLDLSQKTDALALPSGTTAQRPGSPVNGMIRYNSTTTPILEAYVNGAWISLGGGGSSTITLGTSANVTNPQRSSDATTGFYSSAVGKADVSAGGNQITDWSSTGESIVQGTLTVGVPSTTLGRLLLEGSTSGTVILAPQPAAGTPTLTFGTASGTPVVTATSPLTITTATGNLAITGVAGQVPNGLTGAFTATPTLGVNATTTGQVILANGGASGASVSLQNNGATTAYNFNLPTTAGAKGSLLASGGGSTVAETWIADVASGRVLISQTATTNPAYSATPILGVAGTTLGTLGLAGNTSGTVTIQPAAAAGTWSLTLPTTAGTNGYVLTTNGSGVSSWTSASAILGASSTTTNPSVSGDATTGLFSPASATVAVAVTGAEKMRVTFTGVGIGTTAPATVLHVNGEILAGSTSVACSSTVQGALRYNSAANALQFCDGTNWGNLPSSSCTSSAPAGFIFTNQTGVAVSTLTTSNIVQITGISCNVTTQVSGAGFPQYRVCSDSACATVLTNWTSSSATLANNQYVQMRLTSSNGGSTATTATLSVGSNSTSWTVTTQGYCTGTNPMPGTTCADGTIYAGLDTGNVPIYVNATDSAQTWNNGSGSGTSSGATSTSNGLANTNALVANSDTDSPYNAARYCHNLNFGGHTDWFLPAQVQLQDIVGNCSAISGMTCNYQSYWSSTETSSANAFGASFTYGGGGLAKTSNTLVRCMRETGGASPACGVSGTISTQAQQTLTVPAGCTVTFKAWGAGGGGSNNGNGAGGGYATVTVTAGVSPITYYLATGGGGACYSCGATGGAGTTGYTGGQGAGGGGGGAATGVWTGGYGSSGTPLIVAAGAGGNGGYGMCAYAAGGTGGTQSSSAAGGAASGGVGGGGGGGYPTGGAGSGSCSGFGGTSYAPSAGSTTAGSGSTPANTGDTNYPSGAGAGGGSLGGNGAIYYSY